MTKSATLYDQKEQKTGLKQSPPAADYEGLHIGREFLNVTWRMAMPVVLFAGLGLWADKIWGSKPWMTLLGTLVGFLFAAILVKRQIGPLPQDDPNVIEIARAKRDKEKDEDDE
jgi:F0F1-type ATP synthase assembly protein I